MPQNDIGLNSADPAETAEETPRLRHRNPVAKSILRMVFLAEVFALVLCVSRPYPLIDGGATTIWLLALAYAQASFCSERHEMRPFSLETLHWRCSPGFWLRRFSQMAPSILRKKSCIKPA
jgi:hypothetical protein